MSEAEEKQIAHTPDEEDKDPDSNYKPPPMKTMDELLKMDQDDESLKRYKEALLGGTTAPIAEPNDPRIVIVKKLALLVEGRPSMELDLTGNLDELKKKVFVIKEGIQYRIRIDFLVQREIVTGLRYFQKTHRKKIPVDRMNQMVGSYSPKLEHQSYTTPVEEAPSGLIYRGVYNVTSRFTDDDQHDYLEWDWAFEVKKDWE